LAPFPGQVKFQTELEKLDIFFANIARWQQRKSDCNSAQEKIESDLDLIASEIKIPQNRKKEMWNSVIGEILEIRDDFNNLHSFKLKLSN
jgi:hypothetical protein